MIVLGDVTALELVNVLDRGVPNSERVLIRAKETTEMAQYGLLVAWAVQAGAAQSGIPINDNLFWFGDGQVNAGDSLFLYTGAGQPRRTVLEGTNQVAYVLHWGRPSTVFANTNIIPILFRFGEATLGRRVIDLPQFPALK